MVRRTLVIDRSCLSFSPITARRTRLRTCCATAAAAAAPLPPPPRLPTPGVPVDRAGCGNGEANTYFVDNPSKRRRMHNNVGAKRDFSCLPADTYRCIIINSIGQLTFFWAAVQKSYCATSMVLPGFSHLLTQAHTHTSTKIHTNEAHRRFTSTVTHPLTTRRIQSTTAQKLVMLYVSMRNSIRGDVRGAMMIVLCSFSTQL